MATMKPSAGFIAEQLERIPEVGDEVETETGTLRVVEVDGARVEQIEYYPADVETDPAFEIAARPAGRPDPEGCARWVSTGPDSIWLVVLLALNAFFVGAEFAVISARRSQIEPKAEGGSRPAATALWAMEHATLMLATCQLGITVCSLVILNVAEPSIHHLLEIPFGETGLSERSVALVSFAVSTWPGDVPARRLR